MKVGFIGLGVMGAPMAANILKGGHELTVYDLAGRADFARVRGGLGARLHQACNRLGAAVVDREFVPAFEDVGRHRRPHHAQSDKSDFHGVLLFVSDEKL